MPPVPELILVFGTSADPFHCGHESLILAATRALERSGRPVHEILIVPVFRHHNIQDNIKRSLPLTYRSRFDLCEIGAEEIGNQLAGKIVHVSNLEEQLVQGTNRPNLSSETMAALRRQTPAEYDLAFLIGGDILSGEDPSFGHWYQWQQLIKTVSLAVCPRKGFTPNPAFLQQLQNEGAHLIFLDELNVPEISSSEIRSRLESGEAIEKLVEEGILSPGIARYITEKDLVKSWRLLDMVQPGSAVNDAPNPLDNLETRIGKLLFRRKQTLSVAESCTGGLISHRITNVPGSSEYFMGGVVSYAYEAKVALLGVNWDTLKTYGAVSRETVLEMSHGVKQALKTDFGMAVSCIAGPGGGTPSKPVGTSWCGLSTPEGDEAVLLSLSGDRLEIKNQLAQKALELLLAHLER